MTKKHAPQYFICNLNFKSHNFQPESPFKHVAPTYRGSTTLSFLSLLCSLLRTIIKKVEQFGNSKARLNTPNFADRNGILLKLNNKVNEYPEGLVDKDVVFYLSLAVEIPEVVLKRYLIILTIEDKLNPKAAPRTRWHAMQTLSHSRLQEWSHQLLFTPTVMRSMRLMTTTLALYQSQPSQQATTTTHLYSPTDQTQTGWMTKTKIGLGEQRQQFE
jgi:hypothetical protein